MIISLSLGGFAAFVVRFQGLSPLALSVVWGAFVIALGLGRIPMPRFARVICIAAGPAAALLFYGLYEPLSGLDAALWLFVLGQAAIAWFLGFTASYALQGKRFPRPSRLVR